MKFNLYAKALLMGGAIAMVACTNDEPNMGNGDNTTNVPEGDVAYMNVNICNVNGGVSKATSPGYENSDGLKNESKVSAAKFMFFDASGNYMNIQANKWADGGMNGEPGNNIEHFGKNTIVLRGLKGVESYPSYMIVVLNYSNFVPGATLQETADKIVALTNDGEFIMSTTSYFAGDATDAYNKAYHNDDYYFATQLDDKDFKKEPATNDGTSNVNVYVERVAAKVKFSAHEDLEEKTVTTSSGATFKAFPLNITIGGTNNEQEGDLVEGVNKVYVKVLGWGLNATPTQSYLCKKLDTKWKTTAPWADSETYGSWQAPSDYRSFWAQSVVYGKDITKDNVVYNSYSKLDTKVGGSVYTHENTNSVEKVSDEGKLIKKAVTSILVKAEVVNGEGEGLDLIEIWGRYYTYDGFKGLVASNMATLGNKMNFYYVTKITENVPVLDAEGNQVYKQYDADDEEGHKKGDFVLDANGEKIPLTQAVKEYEQFGADQLDIIAGNNGTGSVTVAAADIKDLSKDEKIYKKVGDEYVVNEKAEADFADDLKKVIKNYPDKITAFNGGAMYYNIPVEHLNMNNYDPETKTYTGVAEGNYGIVRNHYYKVTFSKLAKLGHGVFNPGGGEDPTNPGEPIIPDEDEDDTYFLGSTINILSWKVVEQDVEL